MRIVPFFRNLRIRTKLLISYTTVFFLAMSTGSVVIYTFVRQTIEANIESELKNTTAAILNMVHTSATTSIKNHLRAIAEKNRDIAAYFFKLSQDGELTEAEAKYRAAKVLLSQQIGQTGYIYCLNSSGIIDVHPKQALQRVDLSENAFIREQKKRKNGYLEYDWQNPGENQARAKALYMVYFEPWDWIISASSYRGEFNKLIKVDDFRQSILSLRFGKTGYSYVIDTKGNLIAHPQLEGRNYFNARDAKGNYFIRDMCARKSGKIVYTWKNPGDTRYRHKLVIFNHIPEFDWIVASSSYLDEFYAPLETIREIFLVTVMTFMILVLPLTLRISSSITNPLTELTDKLAKGVEGGVKMRMRTDTADEIGKLASYFNTFMDRLDAYSQSLQEEILERRKAEAAIRQSEAKYRDLVQNANSIILRIDTQGNFTFFNEFAQTFFGYEEADIIGRNLRDTILPAGATEDHPMLRLTTLEIAGGDLQSTCVRRNGQEVWIHWTARANYDSQGNLSEHLCVGNDITASRRASKEIARMRRHLKSIVDAMPSAMVAIDAQKRVSLWNKEAEHLTGMSETQALGTPLEAITPPLSGQMDMVEEAVSTGKTCKKEKVAIFNETTRRFFDLVVFPLGAEQSRGAVIRMDDVTARVRMEEIMVQTEKMMSVGGLAAGMAHEINNPVGAILQSTQNIIRRLSPELPINAEVAQACGGSLSMIRRYLERRQILKFIDGIRQSGERAARTVTNMLSFSRRSDDRKTPIDMAELLEGTIALAAHDYDLRKNYDFRSIHIKRDFAPGIPPWHVRPAKSSRSSSIFCATPPRPLRKHPVSSSASGRTGTWP
jgi:PAS domain S-box-containing protein